MTEFELLEELQKEIGLPDIEPDEVTAQLVADYTGCSWSKASGCSRRNWLPAKSPLAKSELATASRRLLIERRSNALIRLPL